MAVTDLLTALRAGGSVFGAELRPPRAELATHEGMDAWIDTYHAVRRLTRQGTFVFLTDSAVGAEEEAITTTPSRTTKAFAKRGFSAAASTRWRVTGTTLRSVRSCAA